MKNTLQDNDFNFINVFNYSLLKWNYLKVEIKLSYKIWQPQFNDKKNCLITVTSLQESPLC